MKFKTKGFTSLLLAGCFTVAAFSGVILYLTPRGRVANWTGWTMLGLDKHEWGALHINACLLLLLVSAVHLFLNGRVFWSYIKKRSAAGVNLKLEMAVTLLVTAGLVAGTLWQVPPLTAPITWNEQIKNHWEQDAPQGPVPHAEGFTVDRFARTLGLTPDDVLSSLRQAGYVVEDTTATIGTLAADNGIVPGQVFAAVRRSHPEAASALPGGGRGMGRGMGGQGRGRGQGFGSGAGGGCGVDQPGTAGHPSCAATGGDAAGGCESDSCDAATRQADPASDQAGPGPGHGRGRGQGGGMGPGWMRGGGGGGMGLGRWRDNDARPAKGQEQSAAGAEEAAGEAGVSTPED